MEKKRNGEIDALRLIFSISIVIFHFNDLYDYDVFSNGNICVEFFFLVSGFLMAKQIQRMQPTNTMTASEIASTTWKLTFKKLKGLYCYFISVVVLQIIVRYIIVQRINLEELINGLLRSIPNISLTFMGLIPEHDVVFYAGNTWFLSALLIAILILYPMLLKSYDFSSKIIFPILSVFLIGYLYASNESITVWKGWTGFCYEGILRAIAELSLGACLCSLSDLISKKLAWLINSKRIIIKLALTVFKILCYGAVLGFAYGFDLGDNFSIFALFFCTIGILLSFTNVGYCIPDCKLTRFLGKKSLPIFIYHGFIRWTFSDIYTANEVTFKMFVLMIIGTIIAAVLLMYITDLFMLGMRFIVSKIKKFA